MQVLDIKNLTIEIKIPQGVVKAVENFSFTLAEGEIRGLVGESGSGKSIVAKALVGLCKDNWKITADYIRLGKINLLSLTPKERRMLISKEIAMIFQEASSFLDPSIRIGKQLIASIPARVFGSGVVDNKWWGIFNWRKRHAIALLHKVGIKDHRYVMSCYPYQLTDGECQKVMIAMALAMQPKILIADEPTNDLDPITQEQILRLLRQMNQLYDTTIVLIGHDLINIAKWANNIVVMYCGQSVEYADSEQILTSPKHPYTLSLLESTPNFFSNLAHKQKLPYLKGTIPPLQHLPIGCRLGPRCNYAQKQCVVTPKLQKYKNYAFSCHFPLNFEKNS